MYVEPLSLVNPRTPEEKRERFLRDLYAIAGAKKPTDALIEMRALAEKHIGPAGAIPSEGQA